MIMTAKAELLRRENHVTYPQYNTRIDTPTTPSQLWNSPTQTQNSGLDTIPQIGDALPGSSGDPTTQRRGNHKPSLSEPAISTGYSAPIPSYAVSPSEPIPVGYVAHARDACVDIDYQWDSTRDPVAWGEGGVLPEEWAGMHQRFRKGLKRLIDWYSTAEHPGQMVTKIPTAHTPVRLNGNGNHECAVEEDEFDTENVVILVSHGAGCNALVGGVTNQPVLADVPMASLTIAKRRPAFDETKNPVDERVMASLDDGLSRNKLTVPDLYELRMFASIDHLTGGSGAVSRSSSINAGSRGRDSRNSGSVLRDINFGAHYGQPQDNRSNSVTLTLGDVRRASAGINPGARSISLVSSGGIKGGITVGSGMKSFGTAPRTTSFGMWTPRQEARDPVEEPDLPMTLDFSHEKESSKKSPEPIVEVPELETEHLPVLQPPAQSEEHDDFKVITSPSLSSGSGMWGVPRPPDDAERMRDFSSQKRRWTVTERQPVVHRS